MIKFIYLYKKKQKEQNKSLLLLLGTTAARSLGFLDRLLVRLDVAAAHSLHEAGCLPWALEVTDSRLAENVDLNELGFEGAFEGNNAFAKQSTSGRKIMSVCGGGGEETYSGSKEGWCT